MKLLKRGSKGNDVKAVQNALKIDADGIFGVITEFAVKAFQRDHNLVVDGIVGQHTWDALFPPFAPSSDDAPLRLKKSSRKITEIIVHCTATPEGNDTTVEAIRKMHMRDRGFSDIGYHYVVYLDGSIHEGRSVHQAGAHCSGHNSNSIGVVYVGGLENIPGVPYEKLPPKDTRTSAQKKALLKLVKALMKLYRLPSSRVYGHYQFANKACPSFKIEPFRRELDSMS